MPFPIIGAAICLLGVAVIMYAPRSSAEPIHTAHWRTGDIYRRHSALGSGSIRL